MSKVGLVIVSHSAGLARGVVELAGQMAPDVRVLAAGGMPDGTLGTDFDTVTAALQRAGSGSGVVLLYDLGSAQMTAEMAVEMLGDPNSAAVVDAPLVEGAVAAAVAAQGGGDLDAVVAAASSAATGPSFDEVQPEPAAEPTPAAGQTAEEQAAEIELTNDVGLHARPAALLATSVADLDAEVTVRFGDQQASAASVLALMALGARGGDRVGISARGPDAAEAVRRVLDLVDRGFNE